MFSFESKMSFTYMSDAVRRHQLHQPAGALGGQRVGVEVALRVHDGAHQRRRDAVALRRRGDVRVELAAACARGPAPERWARARG